MRCRHRQSKEKNEEGREEKEKKKTKKKKILIVVAFRPGMTSGHQEQNISGLGGSSQKNLLSM